MRIIPDTAAKYTLRDAAEACRGTALSGSVSALALPLSPIATDSREVERGDVFIALKGERFDGHDFIALALSHGAACIICERGRAEVADGVTIIEVDDTLSALGDIAAGYLDRVSPKLVAAVTGSVGKTTTKEYLAALLSVKYKTHKTSGNFNNLIGLPLTILSMPADTEALVLEMGMSAEGEIRRLSEIARPNIALITVIGSSHIEHLGSRENICRAKCEVLENVRPGGRVYLPADEPLLDGVGSDRFDTLRVSLSGSGGGLRAENVESVELCTRADLVGYGESYPALIFPTLGLHCLADALLAVEAVRDLGFGYEEIRRGLLAYRPAGMRQLIRHIGDMTVIEDCYNASPESMRASLDVLASLGGDSGGRRVALLGDMYELGEHSEEIHFEVGRYAAKKVELLFTLGAQSAAIARGALSAGMPCERIFSFDDVSLYRECGERIAELLEPGDLLLAKASRATAAERAIAAFEEAIRK